MKKSKWDKKKCKLYTLKRRGATGAKSCPERVKEIKERTDQQWDKGRVPSGTDPQLPSLPTYENVMSEESSASKRQHTKAAANVIQERQPHPSQVGSKTWQCCPVVLALEFWRMHEWKGDGTLIPLRPGNVCQRTSCEEASEWSCVSEVWIVWMTTRY